MCPLYEYACQVCGAGPIEVLVSSADKEEPPMCKSCSWLMTKIPSVASSQHFGEGAYATSRHGSQWRNQWGRKFYRDNEGGNFKATKHVQRLTGSGVKEET